VRLVLTLQVNICALQNVYSYQDDPRAYMVLVVYTCKIVGGELKAGGDVSEVQIYDKQDIPKRIAFSGVRQAIRDYWNVQMLRQAERD